MTYSYTQISQYLRCPRSYRYRYLDGWREKDTRAAMVFGRCFETALGAYFRREDPSAVLFKEWSAFRDTPFEYRKGDSWDRLVHQGVHLLQKFAQDDRVHIPRPKENLQVKMLRALPGNNEFVSYIDALGALDGKECLIDWKTTTSRYPEEPEGLLTLGSSADLLFLDQRYFRCCTGCVRAKAAARDPILEGVDLGRTTPRVWPAG